MEPSAVKGLDQHGIGMPKGEVGPFDSEAEADAAASFVFAQWVATGAIPTTDETRAAIRRSPEGT